MADERILRGLWLDMRFGISTILLREHSQSSLGPALVVQYAVIGADHGLRSCGGLWSFVPFRHHGLAYSSPLFRVIQ